MLVFANPAGVWLLLTRGRRSAFAYLRHVAGLWEARSYLSCLNTVPAIVPEVVITAAFPDLAMDAIELVHPLVEPGGVEAYELIILAGLVRRLQPRRVVEIGTASGRTTLNLANQLPSGSEVVTVDLPPEAEHPDEASGPDYHTLGFERPGLLIEGHRLAARIRAILCNSTEVDWQPYEGTVGLMFIDGGHDYETVRADTEAALRLVPPGGVVLWHDYGQVEGVTVFLNELHQHRPLIWLSGTHLACLEV